MSHAENIRHKLQTKSWGQSVQIPAGWGGPEKGWEPYRKGGTWPSPLPFPASEARLEITEDPSGSGLASPGLDD